MDWIHDNYPKVFDDLVRLAGRNQEEMTKDEERMPLGSQQYGDLKIEIDRGLKP